MLQFCIFGGYEGPLTNNKKCYLTIFGGCELKSPTLARQLIAARNAQEGKGPIPRIVFITLFGSTEIKLPTLTEEFLDLREAIHGGALSIDRWDFYVAELERWRSNSFMSLTLFGAFSETELPSEDEEVESLALQRHFGTINDEASRILEMGVGQSGSNRRAIIQQAIQVA